MCRKERNSCCKPNPYSLIFHHLGTSSVVVSVTASAFYSAAVPESKFPTKQPFRLAGCPRTDAAHPALHTHHRPAEMGAQGRQHFLRNLATGSCLFQGEQEAPQVAQGAISAPLHQTDVPVSALTQTLGKYPEPWSGQVTPRNLASAAEDYLLLLQWSHRCLIFFSASFWMRAQIHRCAQEVDGTRGALKHLSCYFTPPPRCY